MTLREVLNLTLFCAVLLALLSLLLIAGEHPSTHGFSAMESGYYGLCVVTWILMLVTGQAYGIAFCISLYYGGGKGSRGYSRERAWARAGRGQEVAQALLLRDRLVGDSEALLAVLDLAQLDPGAKPEALRAALRLMGRGKLSKADRDHVGRQLMMAKISHSMPNYDQHNKFH